MTDKIKIMIFSWMPQLLKGAQVTVALTVLAVCTGLVISLFLAMGKMSKNVFLRNVCSAYIFFFRGTPLLMQLFFIYYALPMVLPVLTINNRFIAAYIAYSLNAAAYLAEILRAGFQSIDKEQYEEARVLGLSYMQTMRYVIIPQAIRRLLPPVSNEFIMMLKDTSLVSIIALVDITRATRKIQDITASSLIYIPAMILYLIITAIFSIVFRKLEKKYENI